MAGPGKQGVSALASREIIVGIAVNKSYNGDSYGLEFSKIRRMGRIG
ncbi:hypothetical protein LMG28727_04436 [Paraburkholderia kirstenboschensis]|nr:hypothetical protein LMG28727_04436 [Paraburkholderia kirstenboschensis]